MQIGRSGMMQRLKEETVVHHQHAEGRAFARAMMSGTLPRELYVMSLGQRYLIHRSLEAHLHGLRKNNSLVGYLVQERQLQEANLRIDLAFFDVDLGAIRTRIAAGKLLREIEERALSHPLALLGMHYVFECGKNGSRLVATRLQHAYNLKPGPGTMYLDPYGEKQRTCWESFQRDMDLVQFTSQDKDGIIVAAKMTFGYLAELDDELYHPAVGIRG